MRLKSIDMLCCCGVKVHWLQQLEMVRGRKNEMQIRKRAPFGKRDEQKIKSQKGKKKQMPWAWILHLYRYH